MPEPHIPHERLHAAAVVLELALRKLIPDPDAKPWGAFSKLNPVYPPVFASSRDAEPFFWIVETRGRRRWRKPTLEEARRGVFVPAHLQEWVRRPNVESTPSGIVVPDECRDWGFIASNKVPDAILDEVPELRMCVRALRRCRSLAKLITDSLNTSSPEEVHFACAIENIAHTQWVIKYRLSKKNRYLGGGHALSLSYGSRIRQGFINPTVVYQAADLVKKLVLSPTVEHSPDFATMKVGETGYEFNRRQRPAIKMLFEAYKNGPAGVAMAALLKATGTQCKRLRDVFKIKGAAVHPAWKTLIRRVSETRDIYQFDPRI